MESQAGNLRDSFDRITHLEEENKALQEDIKLLGLQLEKQSVIEKRYEESQERFRTIFEQSKFGNKIITSDLQIIQVNNTLQAMLGYSEKELVGTKITAYVHPGFVNQWHELQENLWKKRIPSFQIDTCLVKKDGSTLWCEVTSIVFKDNEATLGYTTLEDITGRKVLEEKLEKHTALINADLEDFVYTASHDLKSPITNIEGLMLVLTTILTSRFSLDEEQIMILSMIGTSVGRLKSTIADLTKIAKVQKEAVEDEIVALDKLIDEVYQDLGTLIGPTPVRLHKYLEVGEIKFAKKNIQSIFYNLLSNAIKYRSAERTPEITVKTQRKGNYIVIQVADNGMGIAENHLPKLFTMFKRFHAHVEGTGIGLYIVKRIVENAGGKIEVESKVGVGTRFRVSLPLLRS